eukprot:COSAG03_NODE_503_length_7396_cov_5.279704_7_plen_97_part_00
MVSSFGEILNPVSSQSDFPPGCDSGDADVASDQERRTAVGVTLLASFLFLLETARWSERALLRGAPPVPELRFHACRWYTSGGAVRRGGALWMAVG